MRRGSNNVFKLSGNIALGGADYLANDIPSKSGSSYKPNSYIQKQSSNYNQYENINSYDNYQKPQSINNKRISQRNLQQADNNKYSYGQNYQNSANRNYSNNNNYQNALNKLSQGTTNNTNSYGSTYKDVKPYKQLNSYKQVNSYQNTNNYQDMKNTKTYQPERNEYNARNLQTYKAGSRQKNRAYENNYQKRESKITSNNYNENYQNQTNQYTQPSRRIPPNQKAINQTQNQKNTNEVQKKQSNQRQFDSYQNDQQIIKHNEIQIKQYDPSCFVMCRQGCGRKFNPDSVSKHQKICKKVFQNKRKEFNTQQQRIVANQQKKLIRQGQINQKRMQQKKKNQPKKQNVPKWKAQSLSLRAILKANRRGGQMTHQQKRVINQAQQSSTVKCKFCGRSFSQKASQRHIPFCQSQQKKNVMKKKK